MKTPALVIVHLVILIPILVVTSLVALIAVALSLIFLVVLLFVMLYRFCISTRQKRQTKEQSERVRKPHSYNYNYDDMYIEPIYKKDYDYDYE